MKNNSTISVGKPVLVYWNVNGRASIAQAIMAAGGIEYDLDDTTANQWPAAKGECPFGQIPILKHGDLVLAQGGAINRYCARIAGLYPSDPKQASICDMYLEEIMDIFSGLFKGKNAPDTEAKKKNWETLREKHLPTHFEFLEKLLQKSGETFLGGKAPNAADIAFFAVYGVYDQAGIEADKVLDRYSKLKLSHLETTKIKGLQSFYPNGATYFSGDPNNDAF